MYIAQRAKQDLDFTVREAANGNKLAQQFLPEYQAKFQKAKAEYELARLNQPIQEDS